MGRRGGAAPGGGRWAQFRGSKPSTWVRANVWNSVVASILLGCPYSSSINHRLVPDQVATREWGMERFPDRSQSNLFLNRMTAENLAEVEQAQHDLLRAHSVACGNAGGGRHRPDRTQGDRQDV